MDYPITAGMALTVAGLGLAVAVFIQVMKPYIDALNINLYVNLIALVLAEAIAFAATFVLGLTAPQDLFTAGMVGLFGTAVAVLGYEVVKNLGGLVGRE